MSFGELPARVVFLLTCSGFSLGGELYPTDLTSVLTISEGFPAAFLSTSMLVKLGEPELRLAAILHEEGVVPGQVMWLLNDVYEVRKGVRPFLLFGDPAGPALRSMDWPGGGRLPRASRKGLMLVRPPTESDALVLAATTAEGHPLEVLRGHEVVAVLPELDVPSKSKEVGLEDRTARLDTLATWLQDAMERLEYAATVERAIARSLGPRLSDKARASALFTESSEIRRQTSASVQAALAAVQGSRERRTWSPHLEDLQLSSCQGLMAWDCLAADLFCEALLWTEELEALLADGAERVSRSRLAPPSPCPLAPDRHTVIETVEKPRCFGNRRLIHRVCMLCGVTEVWAEGGPRLRLRTSGEVRPGGTIGIGVEIAGTPASTSDRGGIIAVVLVEKLTSRFLFRSQAPAPLTSTPLAFEASLPEDLLPETHGVLAVHLDRAHWTLAALRLPAIWLPAFRPS